MARDKNRALILNSSQNSTDIVAIHGSEREIMWVKNNHEIWRSDVVENVERNIEFFASTSYPIKKLALSFDGRYVAYVVRQFPLQKSSDDMFGDYCTQKLGDTVFLRDRITGREQVVYIKNTSTPKVGNLHFLPESATLIFTDDNVYSFDPSAPVVRELTGFSADVEYPHQFTQECDSVTFFARSPHGRYGIFHNETHVYAADYIYDFEKDSVLGNFAYPDDFGGEIILGFVAEDQLLVFDDSYRNFQQSIYPQIALYDVQSNPIIRLATTSRFMFHIPEVSTTSSLGWFITDPYQNDHKETLIFDPVTFKISTSSFDKPQPWQMIRWHHDEESLGWLEHAYNDINFDGITISEGAVSSPASR
jgi:hypothetical protein